MANRIPNEELPRSSTISKVCVYSYKMSFRSPVILIVIPFEANCKFPARKFLIPVTRGKPKLGHRLLECSRQLCVVCGVWCMVSGCLHWALLLGEGGVSSKSQGHGASPASKRIRLTFSALALPKISPFQPRLRREATKHHAR